MTDNISDLIDDIGDLRQQIAELQHLEQMLLEVLESKWNVPGFPFEARGEDYSCRVETTKREVINLKHAREVLPPSLYFQALQEVESIVYEFKPNRKNHHRHSTWERMKQLKTTNR